MKPSRRARTAIAALVVATFACFPAAVRADTVPSTWERARDPDGAEAYDLHRAVQQRLIRTTRTEIDLGERARVLAMLQRAGAEQSKSPLLRFDLAEVYRLLDNHARAAEIYKAALAEFPDHPAAEAAWIRLAFACGHLGDHECERTAYVAVLKLETEDVLRAVPTLNLAETHMYFGDLQEAIDGYRETLRLAGRVSMGETAPLATWGLAVALDRSGNQLDAEKEARFALELERSMGLKNLLRMREIVFFEPAYEIYWYEGLGAAAQAAAAASPRDAVSLWRFAEKSFSAYIEAATPKNDRWLPIAKARLSHIKAQRQRAEKAVGRAPARSADEEATF